MKKQIIMTAVVLVTSLLILTSCENDNHSYNNADKTHKDYGNGYFTTIKEWDDGWCKIVYANDTGVMYFVYDGCKQYGITPLYNADGTLQVYHKD